jgi:hypothetical protein
MESLSLPPRKRRKATHLEPLSATEERCLQHALLLSLRPIPADGATSEDEILDDDDDLIDDSDDHSDESGGRDAKGDEKEAKWERKEIEVKVGSFNSHSGPTGRLSARRGVGAFFGLMFSKKVWNLICSQTNLYARQCIAIKDDPNWTPVTVAELKSWVGCLIEMGLSKMPSIRMYWDTARGHKLVSDRFTRDRFMAIKKYLHLADNTTIAATSVPHPDRLAKIRPLLNILNEIFAKNFQPGRFLTVDEDMCKFKGRSYMKQYMRAKIVKWGYRVWKLCDDNTAYVLKFDVFTGAQKDRVAHGLAYSVVMDMMAQYLDKNHVVVMDNYFTSVPLFLNLLDRSTYACGTVRANRKNLPEDYAIDEDTKRGEHVFWQCGNLVATIWQDKRPVRLLSTCCNATGGDVVVRKQAGGGSIPINCPPALKLYSQHMGGVDRSDRMLRQYSVSRQSKKWWPRLFYYCLDTALANSFILYQQSPNYDDLTFLQYLEKLALTLIGATSPSQSVRAGPQRKRAGAATPPRRSAGNHWPVNTKQQRNCIVCARKGNKGPRSRYACKACDVHLCIDKCFEHYHTRS